MTTQGGVETMELCELEVALAPSTGLAQSLPDLQLRTGLVPSVDISESSIKSSTIAIVDDELLNIKVVRKYLQSAGYDNFVTSTESQKAIGIIISEQPDVVLLDLNMPNVSGLDILEAMRSDACLKRIPVLILTATTDTQTKLKALELGATDFLSKPVDPNELTVRVRNALVVKSYQDHLANNSVRLEHQVRLRTAELAESRKEVIRLLACAAEYRDQETGNHVLRVGRFAAILAEEVGLGRELVELIEQAAVLHDVGKVGIPDSILLKPGRLDDQEIEFMHRHCEYGMNILRGVPCDGSVKLREKFGSMNLSNSPVLELAATIAISHHEKWDGTGYPFGLSGEQIPVEGRITAVADVFDALSSKRPYKEAMPWEKCCQILEEGRGKHFDPQVIDAFFARQSEILEVRKNYADNV